MYRAERVHLDVVARFLRHAERPHELVRLCQVAPYDEVLERRTAAREEIDSIIIEQMSKEKNRQQKKEYSKQKK